MGRPSASSGLAGDRERLRRTRRCVARLPERLDDGRCLLGRELALGHQAQDGVHLVTHRCRIHPVCRSGGAWPPRRRSRRARAPAGSRAARPRRLGGAGAAGGAGGGGGAGTRSRRRGRWMATSPDIELKTISGPPAPTVTRRRSWCPSIRWSRSLLTSVEMPRTSKTAPPTSAMLRSPLTVSIRILLAHGQLSLHVDITGDGVGAQAADDGRHHAEVAGDRVGLDRNGLVGAHGHVTRDAVHARRPAQPGQGQIP